MKAPYIAFRKTPQFYKSWGGSLMCDIGGGCNLSCSFCWARTKHGRVGAEKSPMEIYARAVESGMGVACLTCSEPLLQPDHVIELAQLFAEHEQDDPQHALLVFFPRITLIIETNGIQLSEKIAKAIGIHENIYVRVSIKGISPSDFWSITGAPQKFYEKIWNNIEAAIPYVNMWVAGISYEKDWSEVLERCEKIDPGLTKLFEVEQIKKYLR